MTIILGIVGAVFGYLSGGFVDTDWAGYDPEFGSIAMLDVDPTATERDGTRIGIGVGRGPYASVIVSPDA